MINKKTILAIFLVLNIFSWSAVWSLDKQNNCQVCFLDVGQGDSIFIQPSLGHQIIIDGGPDNSLSQKLEERMPFWDRTIDLIVLTHTDKDHLFGFLDVLKNYKVENILWTGIHVKTSVFREWQKAIKDEGAKIWIAKKGFRINLSANRYFQVLYPFQSLEGREIKTANQTSIVMRLNTDSEKILFTGDIPKKVEHWLVEDNAPLKADILKVPHHGSKTSSSEEFLEAVSPRLAVISVGRNNHYGLPSPDILSRLHRFGIKVLQTSNQKDICLIQKKNAPFLFLSPTQ